MKKLSCPQCDIHRFFVKNEQGETRLVNVTDQYEVLAVKDDVILLGMFLERITKIFEKWSPQALLK